MISIVKLRVSSIRRDVAGARGSLLACGPLPLAREGFVELPLKIGDAVGIKGRASISVFLTFFIRRDLRRLGGKSARTRHRQWLSYPAVNLLAITGEDA